MLSRLPELALVCALGLTALAGHAQGKARMWHRIHVLWSLADPVVIAPQADPCDQYQERRAAQPDVPRNLVESARQVFD